MLLPCADFPATASETAGAGRAWDDEQGRARRPAKTLAGVLRGAARGLGRRLRRERRRRLVGRAYDMALEVSRLIPQGSRVLDVGCGSGFIAHHLSAILGADVTGLDLGERAAAPIEYLSYDGTRLPVADHSFDALLLCYVLHHARDHGAFLCETRRALRRGGLAVVYEDEPAAWWDRLVCRAHDRAWRRRTGPCTFRRGAEWRALFRAAGFEVVAERRLSRWRNLAHPVSRRLYVLRACAESA